MHRRRRQAGELVEMPSRFAARAPTESDKGDVLSRTETLCALNMAHKPGWIAHKFKEKIRTLAERARSSGAGAAVSDHPRLDSRPADRLRESPAKGDVAMIRDPLRERCRGRWHGILPAIGIDRSYLTGKNGPCPLCPGGKRPLALPRYRRHRHLDMHPLRQRQRHRLGDEVHRPAVQAGRGADRGRAR